MVLFYLSVPAAVFKFCEHVWLVSLGHALAVSVDPASFFDDKFTSCYHFARENNPLMVYKDRSRQSSRATQQYSNNGLTFPTPRFHYFGGHTKIQISKDTKALRRGAYRSL